MVDHSLPRWSKIVSSLESARSLGQRFKLERPVANIEDLRRRARRRTAKMVFDYADGAADDEIGLDRTRELFKQIEYIPRVLRDVVPCDTSAMILGQEVNYPFAFAPTGYNRMMHSEGETAVARVAERNGIVYTLSTMSTTTPEQLMDVTPGGNNWFQLYFWRDRALSEALLDAVADAGFRVLMLTVDLPVSGVRMRDIRNELTIPPTLTWRTMLDGVAHPRWWYDFLTAESLSVGAFRSPDGSTARPGNQTIDASVNFGDLEWLRDRWNGPLVVKGVQNVADARRIVEIGANAIVLSNHGGRQLDRSPVPLRLLEPMIDAIGAEAEVYVDGGVMSGSDVLAGIALGANAVFVGRAYLYGLMADGEAGVQNMVDMFARDIRRTMRLLGVTSLAELTPDMVRLPRDPR